MGVSTRLKGSHIRAIMAAEQPRMARAVPRCPWPTQDLAGGILLVITSGHRSCWWLVMVAQLPHLHGTLHASCEMHNMCGILYWHDIQACLLSLLNWHLWNVVVVVASFVAWFICSEFINFSRDISFWPLSKWWCCSRATNLIDRLDCDNIFVMSVRQRIICACVINLKSSWWLRVNMMKGMYANLSVISTRNDESKGQGNEGYENVKDSLLKFVTSSD